MMLCKKHGLTILKVCQQCSDERKDQQIAALQAKLDSKRKIIFDVHTIRDAIEEHISGLEEDDCCRELGQNIVKDLNKAIMEKE